MKFLISISLILFAFAATATTNELVVDGNSLNNLPAPPDNWVSLIQLPAGCGKTNIAVSGNDAAEQISLMSANLFPNLDPACNRRVIHWLEIGNTIAHGGTDLDAVHDFTNYIGLARAQDPEVWFVVGTAWSRNDLTTQQNTYRTNANQILRTVYSQFPNVLLVDYEADPRLDINQHPENFNGDGIHPSAGGAMVITNDNMDTIVFALTNGVVSLPVLKVGTMTGGMVHWGR